MSTTSLKLPDELTQRVTAAAQELGMSTHVFMVGAIQQAVDAAEQRLEFIAQAQAARAEMLQSGLGHEENDVRTYLRKRLTGQQADRPAAKPWRK